MRRDAPSTGTYAAVLDARGDLVVAVADMAATDGLSPADVESVRDLVATAALVVLDGNLAPDTVGCGARPGGGRTTCRWCSTRSACPRPGRLADLLRPDRPVHLVTPNADELAALRAGPADTPDQRIAAARALHDRGVERVWVRLGDRGLAAERARRRRGVPGDADRRSSTSPVRATPCWPRSATPCSAVPDPRRRPPSGTRPPSLTVASPHTVRPDLTDRLVESLLA